jgi:gluconate 2-dehydrogenase gamma chain
LITPVRSLTRRARTRCTRRGLLYAGAVVGSSAVVGVPAKARTIKGEFPWSPGISDAPEPLPAGPNRFFEADEAAFIDAAVARLIPSDDLGPGAKEAGATQFIDGQLAGAYGRAEGWYMQGPWQEGSSSQGYQSRLTPAQFYRAAIKPIDDYCRGQFAGKAFRELSPAEQDQVLSGLEKDEIKLEGVKAKSFFELLLQNTIESFLSDPIYGGNRDMVGWKLIGFPGARYDYRPYVGRHGEKLDLRPVGLKGRPDWTPRG